jgi:hypothetical protein
VLVQKGVSTTLDLSYSQEGVGNIAINDAFLVESAIYKILYRRFRSHPAYVDFLELMHEVGLILLELS